MENIEKLRSEVKNFILERDMTLHVASGFFTVSIACLWRFLNGDTKPHDRTLYKIRKMMGGL